MLRRSLLLLLVLPLMLTAVRKAGLIDPGPIAIPADLEEKEIVTAIRSAPIACTWTPGESSPGRIHPTLYIRAHRAAIGITYDQENVRISHVSTRIPTASKRTARPVFTATTPAGSIT